MIGPEIKMRAGEVRTVTRFLETIDVATGIWRVEDLSAAQSIHWRVWGPIGDPEAATVIDADLPASSDPTNGAIALHFDGSLAPGSYRALITVTFGLNLVKKYPLDGFLVITVDPDLPEKVAP